MKLSVEVLAEIIDTVREGIVNGVDISDRLRKLDLVVDSSTQQLTLSSDWVNSNKRLLNE